MGDLVLKYVEEIKKRKLSPNTVDAYYRDIKNFIEFVGEKEEGLFLADTVTVMSYIQSLQKSGKANSSIVRNLISIRNFYKYLVRNKIITEDPTIEYSIPKTKRTVPQVLTIEEVDRLLTSPDGTNFKGIRDKAMLEVMYATGVKVSELLNLTILDVNLKLCYIKCKTSKNKERVIPIGEYAVNCLELYLKSREENNLCHVNLLFFNIQGNKMTRQGFWKIIKYYGIESGINKEINSYTLRHSFAVHLLQNGADIKSVQELLGHTEMATTQIYALASKRNKVAEMYKKTHPRA